MPCIAGIAASCEQPVAVTKLPLRKRRYSRNPVSLDESCSFRLRFTGENIIADTVQVKEKPRRINKLLDSKRSLFFNDIARWTQLVCHGSANHLTTFSVGRLAPAQEQPVRIVFPFAAGDCGDAPVRRIGGLRSRARR
jgi:hypothetical protein